MMLVTLDQAKSHMRVDYDAEDALITTYVHAASGAILNYLKSDGEQYLNSNGNIIPEIVPFVVTAATLIMTDYLYRLRGDNEGSAYERGYLPMPVTALLYPLRDPALA